VVTANRDSRERFGAGKLRIEVNETCLNGIWIQNEATSHECTTKSKLSTSNKLLIYKAILKPIWTYGLQLWGTASTSNKEIPERFQSKALRMIVNGSWYVPNTVI
jgi:hypothetical protein